MSRPEFVLRSGCESLWAVLVETVVLALENLAIVLYFVFAIPACVLQSVKGAVTELAVEDLVQLIAQMEAHMNTAGQASRDAAEHATAAENSARAAETAAAGAAQAAGLRP